MEDVKQREKEKIIKVIIKKYIFRKVVFLFCFTIFA